ncbi:MAG: hypothetical protein CM15mP49_18250 [Actinomycetota bacterium]|nr:MAG: hypothetical protein CM15mP49_18250 [Actinomycetota bacterium]
MLHSHRTDMFTKPFEIYSLAILLIAVSTVSVVNDRIVDISVGTFPVAATTTASPSPLVWAGNKARA